MSCRAAYYEVRVEVVLGEALKYLKEKNIKNCLFVGWFLILGGTIIWASFHALREWWKYMIVEMSFIAFFSTAHLRSEERNEMTGSGVRREIRGLLMNSQHNQVAGKNPGLTHLNIWSSG